jgi:predicted dehydrogenase
MVMPKIQGRYLGLAYESIRHFIDCLVSGKAPLATGEDGLQATRIVLAMEESAKAGVPVDL